MTLGDKVYAYFAYEKNIQEAYIIGLVNNE